MNAPPVRPSAKGERPRTAAPLALLVLMAVVAAGCGQGEEATGDPLDGSSWEMTSVWDGSELTAANPNAIVTAVFADGTASGSDGCNLYEFSYAIDADSVSFDDLSITGAACDPSEFAPQATAFISAMEAAERFALTEETLELADSDDVVQLRFRSAEELLLAGILWLLEGYAGGEGGLVSPLTGTLISLAFRADGTLVGLAGCNEYSADYQVTGDKLAIDALSHTERACLDPAGVMVQESDYLGVLREARAFDTSLTGLHLLDADGNLAAEYRFGGRIR